VAGGQQEIISKEKRRIMKRKEKDLTVQQEKIEREQYNEGKEWEKIKNEGDGERLENES
jgi:hypothetical protein